MASASKAAKAEAGDVREEASPGPASEPRSTQGRLEGPATQPLIDLDFVRGMIEAVDRSGIDSLEITRAGTRVKIAKTPPAGVAPAWLASAQAPPPPPAAPSSATAEATGAGGGGDSNPAVAPAESGLIEVTSPMVGTFYRAPAPEAPPYVEVGTRVTKGQTLCILEAMKLMNEMEAEQDGVIREIMVENAEPVEYGQPLFRIDPNG